MEHLDMMDVKELMKSMKDTKGMIIDLRNYPKFLSRNLARYLIKTEKNLPKIIQPALDYPGKFLEIKPKTIKPNKKDYYKNKIVILVNNKTQSRAEYATMILQEADNVITIGNQTAGADGEITTIQFMGFGTYMTREGVFTKMTHLLKEEELKSMLIYLQHL